MRRVAAKLSLFVGGGNLIMVGHGWLWLVVVKSWLVVDGRGWWQQKYVWSWVLAAKYAWSWMVARFSNTSSICIFSLSETIKWRKSVLEGKYHKFSHKRFYANCPRGKFLPTPKLTLTETLTPTGGNFLRGQLSGCPPTLNVTITLTQTLTLNLGGGGWGAVFLGGNCPDTLFRF